MAEKTVMDMVEQIDQVMFGMKRVIELAFVALYTKGHILLEGNPGLGKTALARNLSDALGLPFGRIQFTPDLLPSDITGTLRPIENNGGFTMDFQPGPIFTSFLLADEINRATPKTQAAMLEAMAERQTTVLGEQYPLHKWDFINRQRESIEDYGRPFMVMATQNPIDQEGTYDLPEAQSDRFMFKILMPIPNTQSLQQILRKTTSQVDEEHVAQNPNIREALDDYNRIVSSIRGVDVSEFSPLYVHIHNMFMATNLRHRDIDTRNFNRHQEQRLHQLMKHIRYGLGPRGARDMILGAKARAFLFSNGNPSEANLAEVILPILRHRLKLTYGWDQDIDVPTDVESDRRMDYFIRELAVACAPNSQSYGDNFEHKIDNVLMEKEY